MPDALAETMIPPSGPTMADLLGKVAPALSATSDLPADVPAVVKAPPTSASNEAPSKDAAVPADKPVDAKDDSATKTEHVEDEPDSGEQGDATDAAPVADAKAKTPRGVQKRLDELTAQRAAAEQRAVEADKRAAEAIELANRLSREKSEKEAAIAAAEPRPTRDKFDDPDKYDAALIDWSARQTARSTEAQIEKRRAEERQADELRQQKQDQSTRQKEWGQKREKALQEMPDYAEVAERSDLVITTSMAEVILADDHGPKIAYHLGKNPEEASRIASLSPHQQAYEIGKIAALVSRPVRAEVSKAPPPIKPAGTRAGAVTKGPAEMSMEEYAAHRNAQLRQR